MTREEAIERIKARFDKWALDDEDMKAIQTLIPELAESEDEKIREWLIAELKDDYFTDYTPDETKAKAEKVIAWLENQKETSINWMKSDNVKNPDKPYIDKAGMFYTTDGRMCYASEIEKQRDENAKDSFERGIRVGMIRQQKEQKPIKWTDLTWKDIVELEGIINNVHYDFSAGIGQESFGKEVLERFRSTKGIEYLDEAEQKCWRIVLPQPYYAFEEGQKEQKSAECEDCAMYLSGNCIHPNGKCENVKSKQEWSEEDKRMFSRCIKSIECSKKFADSETYKAAKDVEINWLKDIYLSLKKHNEAMEKLCSNEWTEEDKVMLDNIIWGVHMKSIKPLDEMDDRSGYKKYEDFLKALPERFNPQPKQEWSDEDKEMLECVIMDVESAKKNYLKSTTEVVRQGAIIADKELAWLKALKPHWKPSKEQMEALRKLMKYAVSLSSYYDIQKEIESLYNDLNKLK